MTPARRIRRLAALIPGPILALILALPAASFDLPPRAASPLSLRQIHSGHSLTDSYMSHPWPGRLILPLAALPGTRPHDTVFASVIPGSSLRWRWDHATAFPDARRDIAGFDLLVTTESVPLPTDAAGLAATLAALDRWIAHAWAAGRGGAGAEVMLYSTWIPWQGGDLRDWRAALLAEGARWEQMQDHANAHRPAGMPPVYMIPGHRLMLRLADDITAGAAPGLRSMGDLFADDIHLNPTGMYAVTMLVHAVIHQHDPRGLPDRLADADAAIPPALARYLKALAWQVARSSPRSGLPPG